MRFCPKCGELYVDQLLAFCLADGAPLGVVKQDSDVWKEGSRLLEQKQSALKTQQRKLKWRRVMLTAMLMATMVVSIASVSRSIYVTVEPARGQLCITAFNDLNGNGLQDASEPALSGFQVEVRGTDLAKTFTTDVNGSICSDLPIGTYTIVEQPRDGLIATTQTVTLTADQTANLIFGSRHETGSIRVAKFDDLNHNGVQDPGEPGVSGVVLRVSGANITTTLTTGPDGIASVVVPVGAYTVVEQPQDGTTAITQTVTVTEGHTANLSFAIGKARGKLCIKTFDDSNGNRVPDAGEPGLSGFVFQVSATGAVTLLTTDSDGTICSDMPVGKYTVVAQPQGGWIATTPKTQTITVNANQTAPALFGSKRQRGKLCITAFDDSNGNHVRDASEAGLPGLVFQVSGTGTTTKLTTDSQGRICSELSAGNYTVIGQPPRSWSATTDTTLTVTVTAGQKTNVVFGSRHEIKQERGTLCIAAFNDLNGNHAHEADEPGLFGFGFQVSGTEAATRLQTDRNGTACADLPLGTYTVMAIPQPGWNPTTATKQTVILTSNRSGPWFFGYAKSEPACSDADKSREWQIIRNRYESNWLKSIEAERENIIAKAAPRANGKVTARLGPIEPQVIFKPCTRVYVALRYVWIVEVLGGNEKPRTQSIRRERTFTCEKSAAGWICSK